MTRAGSRSMVKLLLAAGIAVAALSPAAAAEPVIVAKQQLADGRHLLSHEVIVAAPLETVWQAISTPEGWTRWAVPVAWAAGPDVIETSYSAKAKAGDVSTIQQQILFTAPPRLMAWRTIKAPAGFTGLETYTKVTSLFELEPLGESQTRVRLIGSGYADTEEGRRLLTFFERGNRISLEALRDKVGVVGPASPIAAGMQPLAFLVGHCWRGAFTSRGQVDTHCFEAIYGGKHIRDRHEVTGGKEVYRGETIYSWNPATKRIEYVYWNSLGGVSRGSMVPKPDGSLDFGDQKHRRPDGSEMTIATEWRRPSPDSYESVSIVNGVTGDRSVTYKRID